MFRYSRCGLLRSPNLSGFFGVQCRSGAGLNVSGPIDFRLILGMKGIIGIGHEGNIISVMEWRT
jgi:hypothetical protein